MSITSLHGQFSTTELHINFTDIPLAQKAAPDVRGKGIAASCQPKARVSKLYGWN